MPRNILNMPRNILNMPRNIGMPHNILIMQKNVSEYKGNVLNHIVGYIQKKLNTKEQCFYCNLFLSNLKILRSDKLLSRKNRGRLTLSLLEFEQIVQICESVFSNILQEQGGKFIPLSLRLSGIEFSLVWD
jgi:hypothetical protein